MWGGDDADTNNANQDNQNDISFQCGDGEVQGLEECDDGLANSDTEADACRTNCLLPHCGDGEGRPVPAVSARDPLPGREAAVFLQLLIGTAGPPADQEEGPPLVLRARDGRRTAEHRAICQWTGL